MATTAKARKSELDRGFNVTVEQSIGRVRFSDTGDHSPVECAFLLIAQHQETWSSGHDALYRLPGPDEGQVIEINVTCHEGRDTEPYFN